MKLRKIISALLCLSLLFAALATFGIVGYAESASEETGEKTPERLGVGEGASKIDGKKILIAGCSYSYYGGFVERTGGNQLEQDYRTTGEKGFFKRLCTQNGAKNVKVTDWTYGGHDLTDLFDGSCAAGDENCPGRDHLADLEDRNYDIVILQDIITPGHTTPEEYVENVRRAMAPFLEVNPNTEFYLLVHHRYYQQANYAPLTDSVQLIKEQLGVKVIDWGAMVYDIVKGNVQVEGSELIYDYYSFVVSNNKDDGYHQNLIAGYLTAIITYATLTGETTVGQPYKFIYSLSSKYLNIDTFISSHYKYDNPSTERDERVTNMKEIFYSDVDMLGLQKLAEEYLTKERWLDFASYDVEFYAEGELLSSEEYAWGEEIVIPEAPVKPADNVNKYTFVGWDKTVDTHCSGNVKYNAVYEQSAIKYTVSFLDDDGTTLASGEYGWGDTVTPPTVVAKEDDNYKYSFKSWDKAVTACVGDAVYTATYVRTGKGATVTFRNYDGTLITIEECKIGDTVIPPQAPTRAPDDVYTYEFAGWDKEIMPCDGDAEYIAVFTAVYIDYTVKFLDENGEVILEALYHWGDTVTVPDAPEKAADNEKTYSFVGWDSEVVACAGDAVYTARYEGAWILYTVVFFDADGEVIVSRSLHWGDNVVAPEAPAKVSDEEYDYVFAGWDKEITECRGTASYNALYTAVPKPEAPEESDEPALPGDSDASAEPEAPDMGDVEDKEESILDKIAEFFENLIRWLKSLFGIKE